jgi:hypothetical protein
MHDKNCAHDHKGLLSWILSWRGIVLILTLAGVSYYLLAVHLAHLAVALPYLILLACPLMHILGHKHHQGDKKKD